MKVIEKYISEDGKVFDTEEECIKYEETMMIAKTTLVLLDCDNKVIPTSVETFDNAHAVIVRSNPDISLFLYLCDQTGTVETIVDRPGAYIWDNDCDEWVNVKRKMEQLQPLISRLQMLDDMYTNKKGV